jgi:hypothetical protein
VIGPLPARYSFIVVVVSLLACLGAAYWLASAIQVPFEGYVLGILTGLLVAFVLLHDFSRPTTELPIDHA